MESWGCRRVAGRATGRLRGVKRGLVARGAVVMASLVRTLSVVVHRQRLAGRLPLGRSSSASGKLLAEPKVPPETSRPNVTSARISASPPTSLAAHAI